MAGAREIELAMLSAVAHGNGPNGVVVVRAALFALDRLDREHAAVYVQILWNGLRAPMQRALDAMVMERQTDGGTKYPPFMQKIFERARREGELNGLREALVRLIARTGIALPDR